MICLFCDTSNVKKRPIFVQFNLFSYLLYQCLRILRNESAAFAEILLNFILKVV